MHYSSIVAYVDEAVKATPLTAAFWMYSGLCAREYVRAGVGCVHEGGRMNDARACALASTR